MGEIQASKMWIENPALRKDADKRNSLNDVSYDSLNQSNQQQKYGKYDWVGMNNSNTMGEPS